MSAEVFDKHSLSPSCSHDPERHLDRPASLPFSPSHSPSHNASRSGCSNNSSSTTAVCCGDAKTAHRMSSSESPSSDGGLGGSDGRTSSQESDGQESLCHRRSSGVSSGSAASPSIEGEGGVECAGTDSLRRQRPVDIITPDGGDLEDSLKARQAFQGRTAASLPLPPPKNGVFKMSSKAKLQNLLTRIANRDVFYSGLDECTSDSCGESGPTSFEPFEGSPSSQPPSLYGIKSASVDSPFFHMSSLVSRDGITPTSGGAQLFPRKMGGVWTLNLLDGKLFLFKTSPNSEQPLEVDKEDETELMEGIELAKLLSRMSSPGTPNYYFNLPARVLDAQVDHPHVTPVYTPPTGPQYRLYRQNDSTKMTPTEYVLHHDTVFLVLQEDQNPPIINAITQDEMIANLEKLADEGTNFPDASFNPVVNIKFEAGHRHSASTPNNVAIYFTGKHNKYRYYVTTDAKGRLIPLQKELPLPADDWKYHLEFSNSFFTPPVLLAMAGGGDGGSEGTEGLPSITETESEN